MTMRKLFPLKKSNRRVSKKGDRRTPSADAPDYKSLLEASVQGIVIHRNFKPLFSNDAFAKLFGYDSADEILALPLLRVLIPSDKWPDFETEYDEMVRGEKRAEIRKSRFVHKNGHEFWIALSINVVDWPDGPAIMMTAFDINREVELEHSLLQNEQKLRSVLEILPYPIYIARKQDGQLLFVNRKSCLLFQQTANQFLKMSAVDLYVDPNDRINLHGLFDHVQDIRDIEVRMKTANGRLFIAELAAILIDYNGSQAFLVALNDISQRKELEAELFRRASTDALTGISNRGHFQLLAEQEVRRARRFARDLTTLMIDIDHFKPINDTYGHAAGDLIIQGVVKRAMESLRQSDFMGRIGGEEFAVVLPETSLAAAKDVSERLRKSIESKPFLSDKHVISCTVSIGVAQLCPQDNGVEDLIRRSDTALYTAKNNGRNRTEVNTLSD